MIHRLRPAESSDFDLLLALHRDRRSGDDPVLVRAEFTRTFAAHDLQVVELDGEPVAMLAVDEEDDPWVLQVLEVAPRWQGRGLGTRLVHDVLLGARARERRVEVALPPGSLAEPMLRRLGFWPVPEHSGPTLRLGWQASERTDVTLEAAVSPWADPRRRRAWARRIFDPDPSDRVAFARFAAGRHGVPTGGAVLDLACGVGQRLRPLAATGFGVTGREIDPVLRAAAEHVAAVSGRGIEVVAGGMADLDEPAIYDLILALDGALWTLLEPEARVEAARRARDALRPGGVLVVEGPNALTMLQAPLERPVRTEVYHRARVSRLPQLVVDPHSGVLEERSTIVVEVDEQEVAEWIEERRLSLLGRPDLVWTLTRAGFIDIETFRDPSATAIGRAMGPTVLMVARRGG